MQGDPHSETIHGKKVPLRANYRLRDARKKGTMIPQNFFCCAGGYSTLRRRVGVAALTRHFYTFFMHFQYTKSADKGQVR